MNTKFKQTEIGEIPEEWRIQDLGQCLTLVIDHRGKTPKKLGGDWAKTGYRALSAKSISQGKIKNEESISLLPEYLYRKWMKKDIKRGDILLTSEGPLGEYYYWDSDEKIVLSQRLFGLRSNSHVNSRYLYHYISSPFFQTELKNRETGTTVTGIKQSELLKTKVVIPPLNEQQQIALILSSLDDKIELNRKMNKTLEDMAKAFFKYWFVDFEFPNEDGKLYKSSGGEMVESELGMIPKGWNVKALSNLSEVLSGFAFPSSLYDNDGKYGLITIKNVQDGQFNPDCDNRIVTPPSKTPDYCYLKSGDVILSLTGNVGRAAVVYGGNFLLNQRVAKVRAINSNDIAFTYTLLRQTHVQNTLISMSRGTAQLNLSPIEMANYPIITPNRKTLDQFSLIATPFYRQFIQNCQHNSSLIQIRDSLLPKLMSGRVRAI